MRKRLARIAAWLVAIVIIAVGVSLWVVTRSWFIIAQAQPILEQRLGGPVHIADAAYLGNGRFVFRGVVIRAPGISGTAGRVGQIDRVELQLDPATMLEGGKAIQALILDGAHLRLSESAQQPGEFSFMALRPDWSSDPDDESATVLPPSIEIRNLQVELGTHNDGTYTKIGVRRLAGEMHPSSSDDSWFVFELGEIDTNGVGIGERGLHVKGDWNVTTNEHNSRLDGLQLDERTYNMCPQLVRDWWDRMQLEGRVDGVQVTWKRDAPVTVELDVADVALTIPVETSNIWARYRDGRVEETPSRPRMRVKEGAIRLEGDHLTLDNLRGELGAAEASEDVVGVPYAVRLEIPELPKLKWQQRSEWLDEALKRAAFEMEFSMDGFRLTSDDVRAQPAVDIPKVVAEALERFEMRDWELDTKVTITRAAPVRGKDDELIAQPEQWTGQAYIKNAACRYENFPYPLSDVEAYLEFDRDVVNLVYLYGYGSEHTRIHLSGTIEPPTNEAAVSLVLTADGMPIDSQLREALNSDQQKVFDSLLHGPGYRGLLAADMLPDVDEIHAARARREVIVHDLSLLRSTVENTDANESEMAEQIRSLRADLARVDRIISAGPFALGGHVDLDLRIDRALGPDEESFVTGKMTIRDGGLLFERFPYPIIITGGIINWERDRIVVDQSESDAGLTFITPAGGLGQVTGEIRFPIGTSRVEPQLVVEVVDDRISTSILAAIPPGVEKLKQSEAARADAVDDALPPWPGATQSDVSKMLKELGLSGRLNYRGTITLDEWQHVTYDFAVAVEDGTAQPGGGASEVVSESGLFWPDGFGIYDINALLRISRDSIELHELHGWHSQEGVVNAQGYMKLATKPSQMQLIVNLLDLPIGEYLIDLAPREGVDRARELWDRYQPDGSFDATFIYATNGEQSAEPELRLRPKQLIAHVGGERVSFQRGTGELWLRDDQVHFEDLQFQLSTGEQMQGLLTLDGIYGVLETDQNLELLGRWSDGRLECPIVTEAMILIGADREAADFNALHPIGTFDATFRYRSPRADAPSDFELALQPKTIELTVHGTSVLATVDPGGTILVQPGAVTTDNLSGILGAGRFVFSGGVQQRDTSTFVDVLIDYDGQLSSPTIQSLLPETARQALQSIDFQDGPGTTLRDGRLQLVQNAVLGSEPDEDVPWSTSFRALVQTDNAAFSGGVTIEQIRGSFDIALRTIPEHEPRLSILADIDSLRTLGNTMTGASAEIKLQPDDRISVQGFRADIHGGIITADAHFGVDQDHSYETTVSLAGVAMEGLLAGDDAEEADGTYLLPAMTDRSGDVYGRLSLQGVRGRPELQTGRGNIRIAQGRIARMPFLLAVLHVMELTLPLSDSLDYGEISFFIEGQQATLDQILFECPTLILRGDGLLNLTTMDMNVLFRSRSTMAVVGDVVGGVSDQLFGIRVSGPLTDPSADLVPLPGLTESDKEPEPMPEMPKRRTAASRD